MLLGWGAYELRQADPLVDLRTSAQAPVLLTNVAAIAIGLMMMAQAVCPSCSRCPPPPAGLGQTILEAGLWMAPGGLMMMLFAPVSSRLIRTSGAKVTLMVGGTVLGAGYLVAFFLMDAPWQLLVASCVASIPASASATPRCPPDPGRGAGPRGGVRRRLNALMRSVGTTLAAAVMGTIPTGRASMPLRSGVRSRPWAPEAVCFVAGALPPSRPWRSLPPSRAECRRPSRRPP